MTLRDLFSSDVEEVILNTDDFAEQITYTRKESPGSPRDINAKISRMEPDDREESSYTRYRAARVTVQNHAEKGVVKPEEGDTIRLVMRVGRPAVTARVTAIIVSNEGYHQLEVTA